MATIVDLKTWKKLDFTSETARVGVVVYCDLLSDFTFSQELLSFLFAAN
jgi:hypothetical protein